MAMVNYFEIIHKYIDPASGLYQIYVPHVILVTNKALVIARTLNLSDDQLQFIEEAGMLHDIGIVKVHAPDIGCHGTEPYPAHTQEGANILRAENLPKHAHVCECHIGVGISKQEVIDQKLPLEHRDFIPETIEERVISFADKFFSKTPGKIWSEKSYEDAKKSVARFGEHFGKRFDDWAKEFRVKL